MIARRYNLWLVGAGLALLAAAGCKQKPEPPPPADFVPRLSSPEAAASDLLTGLQQVARHMAAGETSQAEAWREALRPLVDSEYVRRVLNEHPRMALVIRGDDYDDIEGILRNWASATLYYIAGVQLERMYRARSAAGRVELIVPARGADDEAFIKITCLRGADGAWRVARVEFAYPPPAPATSQPASTQPVPGP